MTGILESLRNDRFTCFAPAGVGNNIEAPTLNEIQEAKLPPQARILETPRTSNQYISIQCISEDDPMLFRYFLDGSQRVTNAGYVVDTANRYLPLLIAQIGVATTHLVGIDLRLKNYDSRNILFFPASFSDEDLDTARKTACRAAKTSRLPLDIEFEKYSVGGPDDKTPMDSARAQVLHRMHCMEIDRISELAAACEVSRDALLLIDGSLAFYGNMEQHTEAFRNVVGVAKSFDLHLPYGKGKNAKQAGAVISSLPWAHRTPARAASHRNLTIASWYLRLHAQDKISSLEYPDGVVKIEVFPEHPRDASPSIEAARCERISQHVLALRAPATPNSDSRWASHLYPVYLTERYIKTQFRSNLSILACL